jgi:hypothetical protein
MAERYKMPDEGAEAAKTLRAFSDRNIAFNQLREARIAEVTARAGNIDSQLAAAESGAARAMENGSWSEQAEYQRQMARLTAQRVQVESEYAHLQNQRPLPADPVAALIESRSSEPLTQQWLRDHPTDALALATGNDPRRAAKLQAAHADAISEGYATGSQSYLDHVEKYLGEKSSGATRGSDKRGQAASAPSGDVEVRLTKKEAEAATDGSVCWGREGGAKCGSPLGLEEYARRKATMEKQGIWYDRLD